MPGEDELIQLRREKLARIRARGIDAYPARTSRTHAAAEAIAAFERWEASGEATRGDAPTVCVAGRITALRDMGKASFLDVRDGTGRIQCYLKKDILERLLDQLKTKPAGLSIALMSSLKDHSKFEYLVQQLQEAGFDCRYEGLRVRASKSLTFEIDKRLAVADLVVFIATPESLGTRWSQYETAAALDQYVRSGRVVGVVLSDEPAPSPPSADWVYARPDGFVSTVEVKSSFLAERRNYLGLSDLDLGDFLAVSGPLFRTRTQEITVEARSYDVLTKALRPPPEKWHGVEDIEIRYRQRYLDLMANAEVREIFRKRSAVIAAIRRYLDARGFIEVETPVLQAEAGGAAATPFVTHHRALDQDFFLRISLELHLKRLVIGGFDRVYEMSRIFRNEGVSWKYNPEFTMLETYEAYADYNDVARMVEDMVSGVARDVFGATTVQFGEHTLDLAPPWARITMRDALIEHAGIDFEELRTRDKLLEELRRRKLSDIDPGWSWSKLLDEAVSHYVEPKLIQPTFLLDYPREISPLAKDKPGAPGIVERFEVFCAGFELGNAYSELNDPIDQRERFETQARLAAAGLEEVETLDEDFLVALEYGMPPTGGFGMGIDRLVMILTGQTSIREVILFPQLRKKES